APMQVPADLDTVVDRTLQALEGAGGVVDPPLVVAGRDAVLGDVDRDAAGAVPGVSDGVLERRRVVLPPGQGAFRSLGDAPRTVRADHRPGVGLHADPVVVAGGGEEVVLPGVRVLRGDLL